MFIYNIYLEFDQARAITDNTMTNRNISQFMQKASDYGLQEFVEIRGELYQESTKKGLPSHQQKELITSVLTLYKIVNTASIFRVERRLN